MDSQSAEARFRYLFENNYRSVAAYFERRIGSDEAFDAADDVFLVAWRRLDDIPLGDRARPWLFGVARNVLANRRRSSARFDRFLARLPVTRVNPVGNPEPAVIQRAEEQAVLDALETLRPQDRELLRLSAWEELAHREIGGILGCSRKAVDARVHRAVSALGESDGAIRTCTGRGGYPIGRTGGTMLTDEQTWTALQRANPVPDPDRLLSDTEMALRFASVSEKRDTMTTFQLETPPARKPTPSPRSRRLRPGWAAVMAFVMVLATAGGIWLAVGTGGGEPADEPTVSSATSSPTTSTSPPTSTPQLPVVETDTWERIDATGLGSVASVLAFPDEPGIRDVSSGPDAFVAVGAVQSEQGMDAAVWTSVDGESWTRVAHDPAVFGSSAGMTIEAVTWGDHGYVAVGFDLTARNGREISGSIWRSPDGRVWTLLPSEGGMGGLNSVTYGDMGYVAAGGGEAWVSADGSTWSPTSGDFGVLGRPTECCADVNDVTYGAGGYVAVGFDDFGGWSEKAAVWTSADATTWTRVEHNDGLFGSAADEDVYFEMFGVAYGSGRYVAVGAAEPAGRAALWISSDGWVWDLLTLDGSAELSDVTYGSEGFVAVGRDRTEGQLWAAVVWTSPDGVHWTRAVLETTEVDSGALAVAAHESTFVTIGWHGDGVAIWRALLAD